MRIIHGIAFAGCTLIASCAVPFSTAVNNYDLGHGQAPASVVLSDPQVYARETLVNDRRDEAAYLRGQLDDSKTIAIAPQIRRDVQVLSGLSAQASILADPAAGAAFDRNQQALNQQQQIDNVNRDTALINAQADRALAQRRLDAIQQGETPSAAQAPPAAPPPAASPPGNDPSVQNPFTDAQIQALTARISNQTAVRATDVPASPQDIFHDRQAYREELRAALADVNLDDGHDIEGNSLYRLQFRATILPGEHRGQFAVARLTFAPPTLTDREIAELYMSWLAYVNRELNVDTLADRPLHGVSAEEAAQYADDSFQSEVSLIGAYSDLFEIVEFSVLAPGASTSIAAPPEAARYLRTAICKSDSGIALQSMTCERAMRLYTIPDVEEKSRTALSLLTPSSQPNTEQLTTEQLRVEQSHRCDALYEQLDAVLTSMQNSQRDPALALSMLVAGAQGGLAIQRGGNDQQRNYRMAALVQYIRTDLSDRQAAAAQTSKDIADAIQNAHITCPDQSKLDGYVFELRNPWKAVFVENPDTLLGSTFYVFRALIQDPRDTAREEAREEGAGPYRPIPRGDMAAFFARPTDLSQRVSSLEGAANAINLALALRAQTGGSGVSGSAGANYVRQAVGRMEMLERAPIVVGFNDRELADACPDASQLAFREDCASHGAPRALPQSGWVFGPPLAPSGSGTRLEAQQNVVNQAISTDISVPGWWPRVQARLETVWIGNWNEGADGRIFRDPHRVAERVFNIDLPHNSVDMHALTRLVSGLGSPLTTPQIIAVTPTNIRMCPSARFLRLQVSGRDIWQSTEAYLNGVAATDVRILPDMGGVDLNFPTANLPLQTRGGPGSTNADLVIWTRDGPTNVWITIQRADASTPFCAQDGSNASASTTAAALTPSQNWIAPGLDFHVDLRDRTALAGRSDIKVQMRHFNADTGAGFGPWTALASESGAPALLAVGDNGTLGFSTPPAATFAGYDEGSLAEISVAIRPRTGGSESVIVASQRVAYYSAAEQTSIDTSPISLTSGDGPMRIVVELPRQPNLRYEGMPTGDNAPDATKISLTGSILQAGQSFQFASSGPWSFVGRTAAGKPRYAATVRFQGAPADAQIFWNALTAAGANGLTAQFTLSINGRQAGNTTPIVLKKQ